MNCAYIRLSEEDVDKDQNYSASILNQIALIEDYARRNNILIHKKYIDDGYSGIHFQRPAFEEMLREIEKNNVDTIITKDFSRLGREFIETSFYITRFFPEHSIRYISINESYDSFDKNNDSKEMMVAIRGIMNDRYIRDTSIKIKAVKKQKTEEGNYMGFIAPYGYKKVRDKNKKITLEIDEATRAVVQYIFILIIDGKSRKDVADILNSMKIPTPMQYMEMTKSRGKNYYDKWTEGIIYRIVRNQTYTGNTYKRKSVKENYKQKKRDYISINDREVMYNTHPAIIDLETFEAANKLIKKNGKKVNRLKDYKGSLDGLVRCGECGKIMSVSGRKKESGRIVYSFYCTDGKNKNKQCSNTKIIFTDKLESIVYEYLDNMLKQIDEEKIIEESNEFVNNKRKLKKSIEMLNKEIELLKIKLKEIYLKKASNQIEVEDFIQRRKDINEKINLKEKNIEQITKEIYTEIQKQQVREKFEELKKENNLMKYIHDLVKEIKFFEDRKIQINCMFKIDNEFQF